MHRLFIALRPPEHIRDLILDVMDDGADFRWQSDAQLHLTLRFIGEVDRPQADDLAAALATLRAPPFEVRLDGLGSFDRRNGGALWAGIEPKESVCALAARIERLCQSAGLPPERRAFMPHITLARWRGPRTREVRAYLEGRKLTSPAFPVDNFILYESHLSRHGAHYEAVAAFPLTK
jgi:2'-5' RNA ligase